MANSALSSSAFGAGGLGSIHNLRCHFKLAGKGAAQLTTQQRKNLAAQAVEACDRKLGELLANDPGVYLLREVRLEMGAVMPQKEGEMPPAKNLGERMTGAIMLDIMRGGSDVVHFANQAEYVAQFIGDLLDKAAWDKWYYHPFARLRASSDRETIRRILEENRDHLPSILAGLQRRHKVDGLLALLGSAEIAAWWARLDKPLDYNQALRPLAAAVLSLAGDLQLWQDAPLALPDLVAAMSGSHPAIDWRDPRSLAANVLSGFMLLLRRRHLRSLAGISDVDLTAALCQLDWLDHRWLQEQLREFAVESAYSAEDSGQDLPLRKAGQPTARQRRLINELLTLLDDPTFRRSLDSSTPTSAGNALRLYAGLIDQAPDWQDDPLAPMLIRRLLRAWEAWRDGEQVKMKRELRGLGEPGEELVRRLGGKEAEAASPADPLLWSTAGLALLLRAVQDARLPALVREISAGEEGYALQGLLAAVFLQLAPAETIEVPTVELPPGMAAVCGGYPMTLAQMREGLRSLPPQALAEGWLEILSGQMMFDRSTMHLYRLSVSGDREILLAASADGMVCALAAALRPGWAKNLPNHIVTGWLETWQAVTAVQPALVTADAEIAKTIQTGPKLREQLRFIEEDNEEERPLARVAHERLAAMWEILGPGKLGLAEYDLPLSLIAAGLLRLWARWLRNFAGSSVPYLLDNFLHRPGVIFVDDEQLRIELEPRPLDMVLEMASYFDPLERLPWLDGRNLIFSTR